MEGNIQTVSAGAVTTSTGFVGLDEDSSLVPLLLMEVTALIEIVYIVAGFNPLGVTAVFAVLPLFIISECLLEY